MISHIGSMAGHLMSSPVSGFHIGHCTDVEPAYFWSQGPLVNRVRSWELIIKHDLTHRFHFRTLGVYPGVRVPHRFVTGPLVEPGSTCESCQKVAIDIKPDFYTSPDTCLSLGVHPSLRVSHRFGTGPVLEPWSTCE